MSDAFAAALWCGDYLLLLANLGCAGINLHGGDSRFLSAGLGDHNPGLDAVGGKEQKVAERLLYPNRFRAGAVCEPPASPLRHAHGPAICWGQRCWVSI